jgi:hypothetical protein
MEELVIYISHRLENRESARYIGGMLSAFGRDRIRVHYSGQYPAGIDWREQMESDLVGASWLILLYDGPQVEWDWCLFETGFFRARMKSSPTERRLICLYSPEHRAPGLLQSFDLVPATQPSLEVLFRQIYLEEPWKINPRLFQEHAELVVQSINRIIATICESEKPRLFFYSPSFTIHVKIDQLEALINGKIPPDSYLTGGGGWETIFGKAPDTVGWSWQDVINGLQSPEPWIYSLAIIMWQAYNFQRVSYPSVGVRIKFDDVDNESRVFRLSLQSADMIENEARFMFVAAAVVTPYEPANNPHETSLYHLFSSSWFFRQRLLKGELNKLDLELLHRPREQAELEKIIREIGNDFMTMLADAQVRGMEQEGAVIQAFDDPLRGEVITKLHEEWPKLYQDLHDSLEVGESAAERISETLHKMEPINRFFLKVSLEELRKYLGDN